MNILDMLSKELSQNNWTLEEKARYLYIRCCELFTYDPRYQFCNYISNGDKLKNEILNKKINLENVTDTWVVCSSHMNEIYGKLLKLLLNIDAKSVKINESSVHVWTEFNDGTNEIKADSAIKICSDLTRTKMKLQTQEYHPTKVDPTYNDKLKRIDQKIGYIKENYEDAYLNQLRKELDEISKNFENKDDILIYKWQIIEKLLKKYENETLPINMQVVLNYLMIRLLTREEINKIEIKDFFQYTTNEDWIFARIYEIALTNETKYFIQPRFKNTFNYYEINQDTSEYYKRKMIYLPKR